MNAAGEHTATGALESMLTSLVEQTVKATLAQMQAVQPPAPALDLERLGFEPMKIIDAKEAARMLGISRVASIYEISEDALPRMRRVGTSVGYLALNVWLYACGRPPVDLAAILESYRERLIQDRPTVRPLHPNEQGKTRVL